MDYSDALAVAGLSKHEALVYRTLLEHGPLHVAGIVRAAGMHRPEVYRVLPILKRKGLVGEMKKSKTIFYVAESPDRVQLLFSDFAQSFERALEDLKTLQKKDGSPVVRFTQGKDAIRDVYYDLVCSLPNHGIFYRYSSSKDGKKAEAYLPKDYRKIRDQKKLERFVISNVRRAATKKPRMERSLRIVSSDFDWFEDDVTMLMYGNVIAYIDYNSETAIVIENAFIASFQIKLFRLLFSKL